ncbi:MAG: hypothetical protein AABY64_14880 [Bdellovibrionota bacterium]
MKTLLVYLLSVSLLACQSKPQKFTEDVHTQQCENALEHIPENETTYKVLNTVQVNGGKLISYTLTGAAYTTEILYDVTIGTIGGVILCSPTILLSLSSSQRNTNSAEPAYCFPYQGQFPWSPPLGRTMRNKTKHLACPNLNNLSQNIRNVAKCFADRKDPENRLRALKTMESIENSKNFYECLSDNERNEFAKQKAELLN